MTTWACRPTERLSGKFGKLRLLTFELKHCHVLMKTSIYRILHFSTLETLTQLIRACPTKGPILGSLQIAAHYSNGLNLMGIVWSSSYCLQFRFFSSILKTWTQVTTKGPVREVSKLPLITAMDWPSCPHWRVDLIYFPNSFLALLDIFWNWNTFLLFFSSSF